MGINILMGGGRRRFMNGMSVPYDAEVEYLESTGVQYIDTRIIPDNALSFEGRFMVTGSADAMCVTACRIGSTTNDSRDQFSFLVYTSIYSRNYVCWGAWETMFDSGNGKEYSNVLCDVAYDNSHIEINGVTCATYQNKNIEPKGISVWLFGRNNNRRLQFPFIGRIYKAVYKMNGKVIMDLIPVRVGNVGYMYNRVNGELLGNSGSGSFILGSDVVDCPFQRVEFLQSSGEQWIDTEFIPEGQDNDIFIEFMPLGYNSAQKGLSKRIFGNNTETGIDKYSIALDANEWWICHNGSANGTGTYGRIYLNNYQKYNVSLFRDFSILVNGTKYSYNGIVGKQNNGKLYLFGLVDSSFGQVFSKIYSFKWVKGNAVVLDLIPVRVGDIGYMYDKVSGKLMGNSGSGSFILGPDIV